MIQAKKGIIVNIGSIGGFAARQWTGVYAAPKSALHTATDSLRVELMPFGIKAILVTPGGVVSNIARRSVDVVRDLEFKIYKPFQKKSNGKSQILPITALARFQSNLFAKKALDVLLKENPSRCFMHGYLSTTYAVLYYMPLWVRDWYFSRKCGISKAVSIGTTKKGI